MNKRIKGIKIRGFKKFRCFDADFNNDINIIVGENESGKSSLLEAITIVLNQSIRYIEKSNIEDMFNVQMISNFKTNPSIENLPKIEILLYLEMTENDVYAEEFYGENYCDSQHYEAYGIQFNCELDKSIASELIADINQGKIPFEYYSLNWNTYKGIPYINKHKPFNYLFIDTSTSSLSYDNYSKNIFMNKYGNGNEIGYKYKFNNGVKETFSKLGLEPIDDTKRFDINGKKLVLENMISIKDSGITLENKGSGAASIIKTDLALNKNLNTNIIAIEEPENHLSHTNLRKMINNITESVDGKQIFITTHNNLIVSHFDLNKICWIDNNSSKLIRLNNIDEETARYFIKLENHNLLQFILAKKVLLVEGPTEALLLPHLYKKEFKESINKKDIDVISCNGLSYERYMKVAKSMDKKIAVITDNDGSIEKINNCAYINKTNSKQHVFTASSVDLFTWEKCLFDENCYSNDFLNLPKYQDDAKYEIKGQENEDRMVRYMQLHKVDFAYKLIESDIDLKLPSYVYEAFEWIRK